MRIRNARSNILGPMACFEKSSQLAVKQILIWNSSIDFDYFLDVKFVF